MPSALTSSQYMPLLVIRFNTFGLDVYDQVQAWCPLTMPPPCADSSFNTDGYHLLTATVPYRP